MSAAPLAQLSTSQHHALLLIASDQQALLQLSLNLAKAKLCLQPQEGQACGKCRACHLFQANNHPDLIQFDPDATISIAAVRDLAEQFRVSANLAHNKVAIIPSIQHATRQAANALLKLLEEPPANCYLILTSNALSAVLPTIRSRCERHLLNTSSDTSLLSTHPEQIQALEQYQAGKISLLACCEQLQQLSLFKALYLIQEWLHQVVQQACDGAAQHKTSLSRYFNCLDRLLALQDATQQQVKLNHQLALEHICLALTE